MIGLDISFLFCYTKGKNGILMAAKDQDGKLTHRRANMRDVAKLAGVSTATVSYVINQRPDQHISEATKKKVLQAINYLNYSPNPYASELNMLRTNTILLRTSKHVSWLQGMETLCFMRAFQPLCEANNFLLSYSEDKRNVRLPASACLCLNMSDEDFHALAQENYIPVLALDCLIDDPFFYQISTDYQKLKAAAAAHFQDDFTYLAISPENERLKEELLSALPGTLFLSEPDELPAILPKLNNVAVSQPSLLRILNVLEDRLNIFDYSKQMKEYLPKIMNAVLQAIGHTVVADSDHFIRI